MNDIKVTVCIPTYNRVGYLKESIDAVLAQEYKAFQLIIMDNCSVDGTREFASSLKDARVRYVRNRQNLGLCMNWRQALGQVDTDYFVMVGDDDIVLPGYLGKTVAELDRHPSAGFAFTLSGTLDVAGRDQAQPFPRNPPPEGLLSGEYFLRYAVEGRDMRIGTSSVLMRRSAVAAVGNFDCVHSGHDIDRNLYIRLATRFSLVFLNETLCMTRFHPEQDSGTTFRTAGGTGPLVLIADRIEALAHLLWLQQGRPDLDAAWFSERLLHLVRRGSEYADYLVPHLNISWPQRREVTVEEIGQHVPNGEAFVVIDNDELDLRYDFGDRAIAFPAVDGDAWAAPDDGREAVAVLRRHVGKGRRYLVLVRPAFWWIDNYVELRRELFKAWRCVWRSSSAMIFELAGAGLADEALRPAT
jgi:glycosyltransferase involved in cell wall biosynthesis